ncbi:MAG: hypothetical protein K2K39_02265 [Clostridia bacterium]|nr:hypothetical protein [Clostridia bacterium]
MTGTMYINYALIGVIPFIVFYGAYFIAGITCAIVFSLRDKKKKERELAAKQSSADTQLPETTQPSDGTDNIN